MTSIADLHIHTTASDGSDTPAELAQKVKEETIRRAKEDAEAIRAKAETEAAERLNGLSEERSAAEKEIAGLKEVAAEYRRQFEALLQAQQEALEKATDLF